MQKHRDFVDRKLYDMMKNGHCIARIATARARAHVSAAAHGMMVCDREDVEHAAMRDRCCDAGAGG